MKILMVMMVCICMPLSAQIECDVTLNTEKVQMYRDRLQNFEQDIENYINSQRWSLDDLQGEKIKCTINIFFISSTDENGYTAQIFIGSQRPIYAGKNPSGRFSPMVRVFDDKWEFTYIKGQPMYRNESQFDALTDMIDYYMYLVLGFDYDSFDKLSGTPYFQKCFSFCNQAPSSAKGWDRGTGTNYSKFQLAEDILNPKNQPFREAFYLYHYKGLDLLATKPETGYKNMIALLTQIAELKKSSTRALIFKTFFEAKYGELAEVFKNYNDKSVYQLLVGIDQAHQTAYDEAVKSR